MTSAPGTRRLMALSGMLAPVSFVALAGVATFITPGYDLLGQTVSRLAGVGQPYAWLVNASFVLYGLLVQGLGPLLYATARARGHGMLLWLLVVQYGVGAALVGFYTVEDQRVVWGVLTADVMHDMLARLAFLAILALCFLAPFLLPRTSEWQTWRRWSLALGALTLAFALPFETNLFAAWTGFLQRGLFATTLLWVFGTSLHFYRLAGSAREPWPKEQTVSTFQH